ncbi:hypothetical protein IV417_05300 [Alphaproteobacteria bacterium KMM 3653]|uniref:Uncharacterized protein n=1 Tax=Harenicola maris TaxID=2841044 RepID=A0AAP2CNN0_9RHOB|nr:hypothetical protein [Harenicola maris]
MQANYSIWLEKSGYSHNTISGYQSEIRRVEEHYGNLDQHYDQDGFRQLAETFAYSRSDAREGRPNPTRLQIDGDIYTNLASYRRAMASYAKFRKTRVQAFTA